MPKKTKSPAPPTAAPATPKQPATQAKAAAPVPAAKPAPAPQAHRAGKPTNPFMAQNPPRLDGRRK